MGNVTGSFSVTGSCCVGASGIVGVSGATSIRNPQAELVPIKNKRNSYIHFYCPRTGKTHCPFGPAIRNNNPLKYKSNEWWIDGIRLSKEYIKKVKYLLDLRNIEEAPLFMNDSILSYPARWVLRFGDKRDIEGLDYEG